MQATLNLSDNPFNPDLGEPLGRLGGVPFCVDETPALSNQISLGVAGMGPARDALKFALFRDADPQNCPPIRESMVLLVLGVRGSGRTTFARIIRKMILDAQPAEQPWSKFECAFDPLQQSSPPDVRQRFDALKEDVARRLGSGPGHALVVIENVPRDHFNDVLSTFGALPQAIRRVFIATSDEVTLKDSDLDATGPRVEPVLLNKLTRTEAETLIRERLPDYRVQNIAALNTDPMLDLFPFAPTAPSTAVGGGEKPLRAVRTWLWRNLDARHQELQRRAAVDVTQASVDELKTRLIP